MSTAHFISSELGLPIQKEDRIREIDNGDLAGMLNSNFFSIENCQYRFTSICQTLSDKLGKEYNERNCKY